MNKFHFLVAKRTLLVLMALVTVFGTVEPVAAQSLEQREAYRMGIHYADVADSSDCSTGTTAATGGTEAQFAQHLFVGVDNAALAKEILAKYNIGGLFLMSQGSPGRVSAELKGSLKELQSSAKTPLFIATDQEYTSTVNSFSLADGKKASDLAGMDDAAVTAEGERIGAALADYGVNMDFAPSVDIQVDSNAVIGSNYRGISGDPNVITAKAKAFSLGLANKKVMPVIKHFPGHGNSSGDSHKELPTTPSLDQLKNSDLKPYETLVKEKSMSVMMGHLNVPGLSDGQPTSTSAKAYEYLRTTLGFQGLIITDELANMVGAGSEPAGERIAKAINAGADMALFNVSDMAKFEEYYNSAKGAVTNGDDSKIQAQKRFFGLNVADTNVTPTSPSGTACCGNGSATTVNLSGNGNREKILAYLMGKGLTLAQATGITGNFQVESFEGIIPNAQEIGKWPKGGFGIAQWTAGRRTGDKLNLVDWLKKTNTIDLYVDGMPKLSDADNDRLLAAELDFFWAEEEDTEKASLDALKAITGNTEADAREAARTFERVHERCSPSNGEAGCDVPKRMDYASEAFKKYSDAAPLANSGSVTAVNASTTNACASTSTNTGAGNFVFYTQWDPESKWAKETFASGTFASDGCGPSSVAEVVATWRDKSITPLEAGRYIESINAAYQGGMLPQVFKNYGLTAKPIGSMEEAIAGLKAGGIVVSSASGSTPYTSGGHFVVYRGITPDGQILLADVNSPAPGKMPDHERADYNTKPWDPNTLMAAIASGHFNSLNLVTNEKSV